MTDKIVAVIEFTGNTEIRDVESLETAVSERWQYETNVELGDGFIRVWRVDE